METWRHKEKCRLTKVNIVNKSWDRMFKIVTVSYRDENMYKIKSP